MFHEFIYEFGCVKVPDDRDSFILKEQKIFQVGAFETLTGARVSFKEAKFAQALRYAILSLRVRLSLTNCFHKSSRRLIQWSFQGC